MAEIEEFIKPKAQKQIKQLLKDAGSLGKSYEAIAKSAKKLDDLIKKVSKSTGDNATNRKKLTAIQKEEQRILRTNAQAHAKLNTLTSNANKVLVERRLRLNEANKELKLETKLQNQASNSRQRAAALVGKLTLERDKLNLSTREGRRRLKELNAEINRNNKFLEKTDDALGRQRTGIGRYTQGVKGAIGQLVGLTSVALAFAAALRSGIRILINYTKANSTLNAILNKSREETAALRKQQEELGKSTAFSATEVTKAQTELARLGLTIQEIKNLTPAILNAAVAFGVEMASAAELVAGQLNAFNLEAKEGQRVADILTRATQISAFNFERLKTALAIVSPAAKASNASIEETVAVLSAAVDANIDASSAATALRNIYIDIADKGITFREALDQINNSQNKLTAANELFGKRGAVVASVIANNTDKIRENTEALNAAAGTAQKFADEQLDNLAGDLTLLKSAWEGFILAVENGDGVLNRIARGGIQLLTKAISGLTNIGNSFEFTWRQMFGVLENASDSLVEAWLNSETVFANSGRKIKDIVNDVTEGVSGKTLVENVQFFQKQLAKELIKNGESFEQAARIAEVWGRVILRDTEIVEESTKVIAESTDTVDEDTNSIDDNTAALQRNIIHRQLLKKGIEDERSEFLKGAEERQAQNDRTLSTEEKLAGDLKSINDRARETEKKAQDEADRIELERIKSREEAKKAIIENSIKLATQLFQGFTDLRVQQISDELNALNAQREAALAGVEGDKNKEAQINAQFDQKQAVLKQKQLKAEQQGALFEIAIQTGINIAKAFPNFPLIALAIALGAAQAAFVKAQKVPQFAKGTGLNGLSKDTFGEYGEKGRELVMIPGQDPFIADKPTRSLLPKGTVIKSNPETEKILAYAQTRSAQQGDLAIMQVDMREELGRVAKNQEKLIRAFRDRPVHMTTFDEKGIRKRLIGPRGTITYLDNRFK